KRMVVIRSPSPQLVPFKLYRFGKQRRYKGKTYILDYDYARKEIRYGRSPQNQWWVKIRDKQGREGWVAEAKNFAHMDRFE
ncbi:hypothetical protein ACEUAE_20520, partial [Aeromonas veronii]